MAAAAAAAAAAAELGGQHSLLVRTAPQPAHFDVATPVVLFLLQDEGFPRAQVAPPLLPHLSRNVGLTYASHPKKDEEPLRPRGIDINHRTFGRTHGCGAAEGHHKNAGARPVVEGRR